MKQEKKIGIIGRLVWIITFSLSILLLLSIISPSISPSKLWIFAFFGLAYPYIATLTAIFTLVLLFFSFKRAFFPILIFIIGIGQCRNTINISATNNKATSESNSFKILSQNVHIFGAYVDPKNNTSDSVVNLIKQENPDIACFQEYFDCERITQKSINYIKEAGNFSDYSNSLYTDSLSDPNLRIITFSKFPIINDGIVKTANNLYRDIFALWSDMIIANDTIRIYNIHLQSVGFTSKEEDLFKNKYNDNEIEKKSKSTIKKLKRAFIARSQEADELALHIKECKYPAFLVGDFNDTPVSYTYRKLIKNKQDAFKKCGKCGIGKTYNGIFPSFRIDYIFYPKQFDAKNFKIHNKKTYSDHFPISCEIQKIK